MTFKQTLDFLYSQLPVYHRVGKSAYKANLDNSKKLDQYFGKPHLKFASIHVAGTNGKGSVSHMLASVLQEAGYKTGLYTSPHLKDFRERIKVNGKMISRKRVVDFVKKHISITKEIKPSFFELTVAMAFDHFATEGVEIAIIETGLGGRLDSTNIVNPVLSIITNIGHDHLDLLGPLLEDVSLEKAGIIKECVPVVIGETQEFSEKVFRKKATVMNAEIFFADKNFTCFSGGFDLKTGIREVEIINVKSSASLTVGTPLGGIYQLKNIPVVLQAVDFLKSDWGISESNLIDGIRNVVKNTGLLGRWQKLGNNPLIICDTGHNKEGLEYVISQLDQIQKTKLHIVLGFVNDKDLTSVLPLFPKDAIYYFTKAPIPRALDEKILMSEAGRFDLMGKAYANVKSAYKAAIESAGKDDIIFIGGSTFIVAEVV